MSHLIKLSHDKLLTLFVFFICVSTCNTISVALLSLHQLTALTDINEYIHLFVHTSDKKTKTFDSLTSRILVRLWALSTKCTRDW